MSSRFLLSLIGVVAGLLAARAFFPGLPLRGKSRQLSRAQAALGSAGVLGLTFHCGAMFFRRTVALLPGTDAVSDDIRALGATSMMWYLAPALFVVLALRSQHPVAVASAALALTAVGITMYDGGSLQIHLITIFVSVLALGAIVATLVLPPPLHRPAVDTQITARG